MSSFAVVFRRETTPRRIDACHLPCISFSTSTVVSIFRWTRYLEGTSTTVPSCRSLRDTSPHHTQTGDRTPACLEQQARAMSLSSRLGVDCFTCLPVSTHVFGPVRQPNAGWLILWTVEASNGSSRLLFLPPELQ
jgi:hypothetical protein